MQGTGTENGRHASLGLLHNNTEWKDITFLLLQTIIAKCLENLRRRIFSDHELPASPSNIIWVGLSMNKQVNKCKKVSSAIKNFKKTPKNKKTKQTRKTPHNKNKERKKPTPQPMTQIPSDAITQNNLQNFTTS